MDEQDASYVKITLFFIKNSGKFMMLQHTVIDNIYRQYTVKMLTFLDRIVVEITETKVVLLYLKF